MHNAHYNNFLAYTYMQKVKRDTLETMKKLKRH